ESYMAVTFLTGFEAQKAGPDGVTLTGAGATYQTTLARSGVACVDCSPASGASAFITVTAGAYVHFGLRLSGAGLVDRLIFGAIAAGTINVRMTPSGTLA